MEEALRLAFHATVLAMARMQNISKKKLIVPLEDIEDAKKAIDTASYQLERILRGDAAS